MDKWLVNMVAGGVLASLLVIFGTGTFVDIVYPTGGAPEAAPEHGGEVASGDHGGGEAPSEAAPQVSLATLLGQATVEAGEKQVKKCAACHSFDDGGPNKIGPNLHGVVGRPVASHEGFAYSPALKEFGGNWDYEKLNCYIASPKDCVPGNKMSFAGVKKDADRADVIAYLRSISPNAPPLPEESKGAEAPAAEGSTSTAANEGGAEAASGAQNAASPGEGESQAAADTSAPAAASTVPAQN